MRARRSATVTITSLAALAALTVLAVLPATAQDAGEPSSAEVQRELSSAEDRLAALEAEASLAVEDVNEAQLALDAAEAELATTSAAAEAATARTAVLRASTDAVARSIYKTGGANLEFGALLGADGPTEAAARYAAVRWVLRDHRGDVEELQAALTELGVLESRLQSQRAVAAARTAELDDRRDRLEATLDAQAGEIAALEAELNEARDREEAARRAAEEAARQEAAREAAERVAAREAAAAQARSAAAPAPQPSTPSSSALEAPRTPQAPPAPSARQSAQVAVDTALAQVGKPYQWGGSGPNSFDCSGLTAYAWRAAGVTLPHSSRAQFSSTTHISRGELQPGDLIYFGSPIHHVALYIGGGKVVEASRSGVPVRVSSTALGRSDIAGYTRP